MRVSSFQDFGRRPGAVLRAPPARLSAAALALFLPLALSSPLAAQFPGEVRGRVLDALSGSPVAGAAVRVHDAAPPEITDGTGAFRLTVPRPGMHEVRVDALGYETAVASVQVHNGRVSDLVVHLVPRPLEGEGVRVRAPRTPGAERRTVRTAENAGARTAGDLVAELPEVVVRERGRGGEQTVSLRGSAPEAVLVLLDGVPLNDPVTGVADLSTVPAFLLEEVAVLPGARSARWGSGAQAGVILLRSRTGEGGLALEGGAGSLGLRWLGGRWSGGDGGWSGGAGYRAADGGFAFRRPPSIGSGVDTRRNADLRTVSAWLAGEGILAGGEWSLRGSGETTERGVPGRSFAPSDSARQRATRARATLSWRRREGTAEREASLHAALQETRFRDPAPPIGLPADDRSRSASVGASVRSEWRPESPSLSLVAVGAETRHQRVRSDLLAEAAPRSRTEAGTWAAVELEWPETFAAPRVSAGARLDRDGGGTLRGSHEISAAVRGGPVTLGLSHRSAYRPPSLADQFFHEGVGVVANPELRGERVPSEWEAEATVAWSRRRAGVSGGVHAYVGDVRDRIVWMPDFRFVWSPRNADVSRRGGGAWGSLEIRTREAGTYALSGSWDYVRATWDRPGTPELPLLYQPRHRARIEAAWRAGEHRIGLGARHVGSRLPVPSRANELPAFWTFDLAAGSGRPLGAWWVEGTLRVDRLLDRRDSFIFGYPEPGRTIEIGMRVRRRRDSDGEER